MRIPVLILGLTLVASSCVAPKTPQTPTKRPTRSPAKSHRPEVIKDPLPERWPAMTGLRWPFRLREIRHYPLPIPPVVRYHPHLPGGDRGSIAVGTVTGGYLVRGARLPLDGKHHRVMRVHRERGTNYGTDEMIAMLKRAARMVAKRYRGSILHVGNISRGGGGDLLWSYSHNNGRDVDISFYILDRREPHEPRKLMHFGRDGRSLPFDGRYQFDNRRNWELVKALITDPRVQIQVIFVANWLKKRLLEYARRRKEKRELISRAESLLRQPGAALPHNDHFHVRILCSKRDLAEGCSDIGRMPAGAQTWPEMRTRRIERLERYLKGHNVDRRRKAIELLGILKSSGSAELIASRLRDRSVAVRRASLVALGRLGASGIVPRLTAALRRESNPELLLLGLSVLKPLRHKSVVGFLRHCLKDRRKGPEGKRVDISCVELLGQQDGFARPGLADLIQLLSGQDAALKEAALVALRRITNHDSSTLGRSHTERPLHLRWDAWYRRNRRFKRSVWVMDGFKLAKYKLKQKRLRRRIPELIRAVDDKIHLSYNAQKMLMALTRHHPRSLSWSRWDAHYYWKRWYRKRRRRFR